MSALILPLLIILLIVLCIIKRVRVYDCFLSGAKDSLSLVKDIFPYVVAIYVCIELFKQSGFSHHISNVLSTPFSYLGIPKEVCELLLLVPLSGNGTIALLEEIISEYGVDSYVSRCAAVIAAGSETIFYISAVYFAGRKIKKLRYAIPVTLFCTLLGTVIACALCRVM